MSSRRQEWEWFAVRDPQTCSFSTWVFRRMRNVRCGRGLYHWYRHSQSNAKYVLLSRRRLACGRYWEYHSKDQAHTQYFLIIKQACQERVVDNQEKGQTCYQGEQVDVCSGREDPLLFSCWFYLERQPPLALDRADRLYWWLRDCSTRSVTHYNTRGLEPKVEKFRIIIDSGCSLWSCFYSEEISLKDSLLFVMTRSC